MYRKKIYIYNKKPLTKLSSSSEMKLIQNDTFVSFCIDSNANVYSYRITKRVKNKKKDRVEETKFIMHFRNHAIRGIINVTVK